MGNAHFIAQLITKTLKALALPIPLCTSVLILIMTIQLFDKILNVDLGAGF